jgi:hypothetical protein
VAAAAAAASDELIPLGENKPFIDEVLYVNTCQGNSPTTDDSRSRAAIETWLQTSTEKELPLKQCNAFLRKLIYQELPRRFVHRAAMKTCLLLPS